MPKPPGSMRSLFLLFICFYAATPAAAPRIVTSIAPVQELTAAITDGVTRPEVIIEGRASPHHFALRPSHLRKLENADLVIWIGKGFESGFHRLPGMLSSSTRQLELMRHFDERHSDGHFWYSPQLLLDAIDVISATLINFDATNRERYEANSAGLRAAINAWRERNAARWREQPPRVITDHAFLGPLKHELALEHVLALHDQHDHGGSLKDLRDIEQRLEQTRFYCLLTLEPYASALGNRVADKYQLRVVDITSGIDTDVASAAILRRLGSLTQALDQCG